MGRVRMLVHTLLIVGVAAGDAVLVRSAGSAERAEREIRVEEQEPDTTWHAAGQGAPTASDGR